MDGQYKIYKSLVLSVHCHIHTCTICIILGAFCRVCVYSIRLTRLGLLSSKRMRVKYMKKPLQWTVDPAVLTQEERMAVENTDLWSLTPGSYEAHKIGFKTILVVRNRHYLSNDIVSVCTWKSVFNSDFSQSIHDRQDYTPVGRYLREYSSTVPGKVLAGDGPAIGQAKGPVTSV